MDKDSSLIEKKAIKKLKLTNKKNIRQMSEIVFSMPQGVFFQCNNMTFQQLKIAYNTNPKFLQIELLSEQMQELLCILLFKIKNNTNLFPTLVTAIKLFYKEVDRKVPSLEEVLSRFNKKEQKYKMKQLSQTNQIIRYLDDKKREESSKRESISRAIHFNDKLRGEYRKQKGRNSTENKCEIRNSSSCQKSSTEKPEPLVKNYDIQKTKGKKKNSSGENKFCQGKKHQRFLYFIYGKADYKFQERFEKQDYHCKVEEEYWEYKTGKSEIYSENLCVVYYKNVKNKVQNTLNNIKKQAILNEPLEIKQKVEALFMSKKLREEFEETYIKLTEDRPNSQTINNHKVVYFFEKMDSTIDENFMAWAKLFIKLARCTKSIKFIE